jgi:hypothetical protein
VSAAAVDPAAPLHLVPILVGICFDLHTTHYQKKGSVEPMEHIFMAGGEGGREGERERRSRYV